MMHTGDAPFVKTHPWWIISTYPPGVRHGVMYFRAE